MMVDDQAGVAARKELNAIVETWATRLHECVAFPCFQPPLTDRMILDSTLISFLSNQTDTTERMITPSQPNEYRLRATSRSAIITSKRTLDAQKAATNRSELFAGLRTPGSATAASNEAGDP